MADDDGRMRIVFMGTPAFAVASLKALLEAGFNVVAVITAADKPAGRGMKMQESEVKKFAKQKGIAVLQPPNLKSPEFVARLRELRPDLQVVVAFRMLPEVVWSLPPLGTINLHASLLPQYRGAAPINHVIINGETETGVTTFRLKHEIDTGNILMQEKLKIDDADTAGTLHDKLKTLGADLLVRTVRGIEEGSLKEISQEKILPAEKLRHAPKIFREDCEINWDQPAEQVYNFIRGLTPHPGAFTFLKGKRIIITEADRETSETQRKAGSYQTDKKSFLKIATANGFIVIRKLKPEGRPEMNVEDYLRGRRDL